MYALIQFNVMAGTSYPNHISTTRAIIKRIPDRMVWNHAIRTSNAKSKVLNKKNVIVWFTCIVRSFVSKPTPKLLPPSIPHHWHPRYMLIIHVLTKHVLRHEQIRSPSLPFCGKILCSLFGDLVFPWLKSRFIWKGVLCWEGAYLWRPI